MNYSTLVLFPLLLLALVSLLRPAAAEADPLSQFSRNARLNRRGFKSSLLSTARGFGKRAGGPPTGVGYLGR